MLNDYFINMLLLISLTFIGGHIVKDIQHKKMNTVLAKVCVGVFCGLIGILLLVYSISVKETNTLIDLRAFAIMIASYVGGFIPTVISGLMILTFRLICYERNVSAIIAVLQILLYIGLFYVIDRRVNIRWKNWIYKLLLQMLIVLITYYYLLNSINEIFTILLLYSIFLVLTGVLEYLLLEYVRTSNELYQRYKNDSTKDFLTGLNNTRQFDKILNMAFERVQLNNETLSCLMIDIDHFKKVNDTYGHAAGDMVLKELAQILKQSIRSVDIAARVGGEEFCVLLFQCPKDQTLEMATRINKAVEAHEFPIGNDSKIRITVSVGISMYPELTPDLDALKEAADTALYTAKRSGRNRVCGL